MNRNDILAEYVRKTRPEIEQSLQYKMHFMARTISDSMNKMVLGLKRCLERSSDRSLKQMASVESYRRSREVYVHGPRKRIAGWGCVDQMTADAMEEAGLAWW